MSTEPELPQHHWQELADSAGALEVKFLSNDLPPRPFKLIVGRAGFTITDENMRWIGFGMLLSVEIDEVSP